MRGDSCFLSTLPVQALSGGMVGGGGGGAALARPAAISKQDISATVTGVSSQTLIIHKSFLNLQRGRGVAVLGTAHFPILSAGQLWRGGDFAYLLLKYSIVFTRRAQSSDRSGSSKVILGGASLEMLINFAPVIHPS